MINCNALLRMQATKICFIVFTIRLKEVRNARLVSKHFLFQKIKAIND